MGATTNVFQEISRGIGKTITVYLDKKIQFRDTGLYINSSANGVLNIVSDTTIAMSGAVTMDSSLVITGALTVNGDFNFGDAVTDNLTISGELIMADDSKLHFGSGEDVSFEYDEDGTNDLRTTAAAALSIGWIATMGTGTTSGAGGEITFSGGAGGATTGAGGAITFTTGAASNVTSGTGSATGAVTLTTGTAGTATTGIAGAGGTISLTGIVGGAATGATGQGGAGSAISIVTGIGGATTDSAAGVETGGAGGALTLTGGAGGAIDNASTGTAGAGSDVGITAGAGGAADAGSSTGGAGGDVTITSGTGGVSSSGTAGADGEIILVSPVTKPVNAVASGIRTIQAVTNVNDTTPTDAELDTAFGTAANLGRGFIGLIDDNNADTIGYICWTTDASWFFIIGTKAT